jgi:hypothetical protein
MSPMKRKIVIGLLAAGTLLGYGAGFASLRRNGCARRVAMEKHVAETCVDAAARHHRDRAEVGAGDVGRRR